MSAVGVDDECDAQPSRDPESQEDGDYEAGDGGGDLGRCDDSPGRLATGQWGLACTLSVLHTLYFWPIAKLWMDLELID